MQLRILGASAALFLASCGLASAPVTGNDPGERYATAGEGQRPAQTTSRGFFVVGPDLYDARGGRFVIRGVSNPHIWFDSGGRDLAYDALGAIAGHGANTVRIVWDTSGSAGDLRRVVARAVALELIPMVELHDVTGNPDRAALLATADYYTRGDVRQVLLDYEEYLLINIANEWSGDDFEGAYREVIARLRAAGIRHTLVIDANDWGQNAQTVLDHGAALLDADPQRNLLFSVHMYQRFADAAEVRRVLDQARAADLPLLVGEFGFQHGTPPQAIPYDVIMARCQQLGDGWLAWSWRGNSGGVDYLDLSDDWVGQSLTPWGESVFNGPDGIAATALRASLFAPAPADPDPPSADDGTGELPLCDANDGQGWGDRFPCGDQVCGKADQDYEQSCRVRAQAWNGLPWCTAFDGRGHGTMYDCNRGAGLSCAKQKPDYVDECAIRRWLPDGTPGCTANDGRGFGSLFACGARLCAKTDDTYATVCVVRGAPAAANGLPYCLANGGAGYGDPFACGLGSGLTCAKTDATYTDWCVATDP